mgnify:CR=1 FL=1
MDSKQNVDCVGGVCNIVNEEKQNLENASKAPIFFPKLSNDAKKHVQLILNQKDLDGSDHSDDESEHSESDDDSKYELELLESLLKSHQKLVDTVHLVISNKYGEDSDDSDSDSDSEEESDGEDEHSDDEHSVEDGGDGK